MVVQVPSVPAPEAPSPPPPAELVGRIELKDPEGRVGPAENTVVWVPDLPGLPITRPLTMTSREKRFEPHVLAVPRGTTVTFPNVDRIYHNVFSRTPGSEFDLGLYRKGASRTTRFVQPGLVRVYCNIHPDMAGLVMVVDSTAFAVTGVDGAYRIQGLPPGRRRVRVWDERGGEQQLTVDLVAGGRSRADATLDGSQYRRRPHKNKFGKDYPPVTRDADRY